MSCDHYNYSISLIRRSSDGWMINSDDVFSTHPFTAELSEKAIGDGYLASKVEGKLSYCIFLSGRVCHSDVYGWIIMMNGWQIFDLASYLQLAQDAWRELEQAQVKEGAITQRLQMIVESKGLVTLLSPIQADQMGGHSNQALSRTSVEKQPEPARNKVKWWKPVALILGVVALLALGIMFSKEIDFYWWRYYANQGDAEAQCNLGACYANGTGVPQDYTEAVRWYRLAADQGLAEAQNNLGACYVKGIGVPQDYSEAVRWFRLAVDQGYAEAQYNLGACYANGTGVPQDYTEAVRWYRLAADQGLAEAQSSLGTCYVNGTGVPQDYSEAVRWYRLAADQGLAEAQNNLGACYDNGIAVAQDHSEAVRWFRLAADQGLAEAQSILGACYYDGIGVPQDYSEAVRWYRLAADQGLAIGQYNLGYHLYNGLGVKPDRKEALGWLKKASAQEDEDAKLLLRQIGEQ